MSLNNYGALHRAITELDLSTELHDDQKVAQVAVFSLTGVMMSMTDALSDKSLNEAEREALLDIAAEAAPFTSKAINLLRGQNMTSDMLADMDEAECIALQQALAEIPAYVQDRRTRPDPVAEPVEQD